MTATKLGQFHFEANEYDFKVCTKKNVTFNFIHLFLISSTKN
jgi:hypothetical protein